MPYVGKVTDGHAVTMEPSVKMIDTLNFNVVWRNETDGKEMHAQLVCSMERGSGPAYAKLKKRCQARLDEQVRRFAAYAERKGVRWEVKQEQKRLRAREKERRELEARRRLKEAAPKLLAALKAMLAGADDASEVARAAIVEAEG